MAFCFLKLKFSCLRFLHKFYLVMMSLAGHIYIYFQMQDCVSFLQRRIYKGATGGNCLLPLEPCLDIMSDVIAHRHSVTCVTLCEVQYYESVRHLCFQPLRMPQSPARQEKGQVPH